MIWEEYKTEFEPDGHLRQIHIKHVSLNDWRAFIDFLQHTETTLDYSIENQPSKLPDDINNIVLNQQQSPCLTLHLDGVTVRCHFSTPENITLDFDPKEIDNEPRAKVIFRLMSTVGRTLNKPVTLTPENNEHKILFIYQPGKGIDYIASKE